MVGVGLIGGSVARALRERGVARRVIGLGRNRERLAAAQAAGVIDDIATSVHELAAFSLAVVCTPVDRIAADVKSLLSVASAAALITDAGSVKGPLCRELASCTQFVGSHPLAGSEQGGWEHSEADLFVGKTCAVTPSGQSSETILAVESFWRSLGMRTVTYAPDEHDRLVALTSHLPHVVAAALAAQLIPEAWPLAATGFRDTTRIASGDPGLWTSILKENRATVSTQVRSLIELLDQFATALDAADSSELHRLLAEGRNAREAWLAGCERQGGS